MLLGDGSPTRHLRLLTGHEVQVKLIAMENVRLTPHIAGWTIESKEKLAQTIVEKIIEKFKN